MPFLNFFLPLFVLMKLLLVFLPLLAWSRKRFCAAGFALADNIIWCLVTLQSAALVTLWVKNFTLISFLLCYYLFITAVTYVRLQVKEETEISYQSTFGNNFILGLICVGLILPLTTYLQMPSRGDALAYHLPMAAQWVQTHSIFAQDSRVWYYPGGYELLTAIFFTLTANSQLWFMSDILAWILFIISSYRLLIILGVNEKAAAIFVGSLVLSPIFCRTLGWGGNDLWVAALVVAMTGALLQAIYKNSRQARAVGLLCIGGLACTKYAALPWVIAIGIYFVFCKRKSFLRLGKLELVAILFSMLIALSFPARNYILTGNPLYPIGVGSLFVWGDTSHIVSLTNKITPQQLSMSELIYQPFTTWRILLEKIFTEIRLICLVVIAAIASNILKLSAWKWNRSDGLVGALLLLSMLMLITQPLVAENVPGTLNQLISGTSLRFFIPCASLLALLFFSKIPKHYATFFAILFFMFTFFGISGKYFFSAEKIILITLLLSLVPPIFCFKIRKIWPIFFLSMWALVVMELVEDAKPKLIKSMRNFRYSHETKVSKILPRSASPQVIIVSTALRAWPLIEMNFRNRIIAVGMALPAEEFVSEANQYAASTIIFAKENLDHDDLKKKSFPPETKRMLPLLGEAWQLSYQDNLVMVFTKKTIF